MNMIINQKITNMTYIVKAQIVLLIRKFSKVQNWSYFKS